jgi:hypothetical protein
MRFSVPRMRRYAGKNETATKTERFLKSRGQVRTDCDIKCEPRCAKTTFEDYAKAVRLRPCGATARHLAVARLNSSRAEADGSSGWTRTSNPPVNSRMLCH